MARIETNRGGNIPNQPISPRLKETKEHVIEAHKFVWVSSEGGKSHQWSVGPTGETVKLDVSNHFPKF